MIVVKNRIIPFKGTLAIALWPFIFVRKNAKSSYDEVDDRHEHIHGRQQLEMLIVLFLLWYGIEWLVRLCILRDGHRAYRAISFEQEAYSNESDEEYLEKRHPYAWLKYLGKQS